MYEARLPCSPYPSDFIALLLMDIRSPKKLTPQSLFQAVEAQSALLLNPLMKRGQ
jgi:hypothetical protein